MMVRCNKRRDPRCAKCHHYVPHEPFDHCTKWNKCYYEVRPEEKTMPVRCLKVRSSKKK